MKSKVEQLLDQLHTELLRLEKDNDFLTEQITKRTLELEMEGESAEIPGVLNLRIAFTVNEFKAVRMPMAAVISQKVFSEIVKWQDQHPDQDPQFGRPR